MGKRGRGWVPASSSALSCLEIKSRCGWNCGCLALFGLFVAVPSLFIPVVLLAAVKMRDEGKTWSTGFNWRSLHCQNHAACFLLLMALWQTTFFLTCWCEGSCAHRCLLCLFDSHEEESLHGGRLLQERISQRPAGALQPHAGTRPTAFLCSHLQVFLKFTSFFGWGFKRHTTDSTDFLVRHLFFFSCQFEEFEFSHKPSNQRPLRTVP